MKQIKPIVLTALGSLVGTGLSVRAIRESLGLKPADVADDESFDERKFYRTLAQGARQLGMVASAMLMERLAARRGPGTSQIEELGSRISDELTSVVLMHIPAAQASLYFDVQPFGEAVATAFPSAGLDVEEAAKCLATGRNTAAIMHLMRVLECGLNSLGRALGVTLNVPGWGPILHRIDAELSKKYTHKAPAWKKDEAFYAESAALLRSVQFAWRNPTMHVTHIYDDEKALEVFQAARAFMRHLSQKLTE